MQIIEATDLAGVRSAVHTFGRASTPLRFVVFPMVHLADAAFYEQVEARLEDCDLVVAEGVTGSSARLRALTATYRWLQPSRRLGLAVQDSPRMSGARPSAGVSFGAAELDPPVINPDISAAELDRSWRRKVPRLTSLAVWLLIPLYAVGMRLFGTRRFIAKSLAMDDIPSPKDALMSDQAHDIIDVLVNERDKPLLKALASIHQERSQEPISVAVVYGARHVPAVVTALHALGYRHRTAEWLTVFTTDS